MARIGCWCRKVGRIMWTSALKVQRAIMLTSICFCSTAIVIEVITRYVLKTSIIGVEELAAYVAFWVYLVGASYGSYERSHIKAELTHLIFPNPRAYAKVRAIVGCITFCLCCYVIPWAYRYFMWGITRLEQSRATLLGSTYPVVYFQVSIAVGLTLMAFYFLIEAIQWLMPLVRGTPVPKEMYASRREIDSWI